MVLLAAVFSGAEEGERIVYQKSTLYHRVFVFREGDVVTLRFRRRGRIIQSQVDLSDPRRHLLEYTTLVYCGLLYDPEPKRMLVVGMGGAVIPRHMRYDFPDLEIDIVEIDADIPKIAEEYFRFRADDKMKVHVSDGRIFVRKMLRQQAAPKYDLVILDAFTDDYIPFHLMTKEFLEEVRGALAPTGVVVANVIRTNQLYDAELATFLAAFGRCHVYRARRSTNAMLVSWGAEGPRLTAEEARRRAERLQQAHGFAFDLVKIAEDGDFDPRPGRGGRVLTDDRAPVDWLRSQERGE
ncbi:MAG: fused MFS/spermidine synthase [Planctomycetota bacterium]